MCSLFVLYSSSDIEDISAKGTSTDKRQAITQSFEVQCVGQPGLSPLKLYDHYFTGSLEIAFL